MAAIVTARQPIRLAIKNHLTRDAPTDGLVYDAVRARLIEIGEAVKDISLRMGSRMAA